MNDVVSKIGNDEVPDLDRPISVVDAIRDAIADGEFAANQRLIESDLSERFGASRGNVRTALVQLSSEGLVERMPNRGARVRAVSLAEAIEITEVRMALEGLCAAKATERLTDEDREQLRGIGAAMQDAVAAGDLLGYSDLPTAARTHPNPRRPGHGPGHPRALAWTERASPVPAGHAARAARACAAAAPRDDRRPLRGRPRRGRGRRPTTSAERDRHPAHDQERLGPPD